MTNADKGEGGCKNYIFLQTFMDGPQYNKFTIVHVHKMLPFQYVRISTSMNFPERHPKNSNNSKEAEKKRNSCIQKIIN